MNQNRYLPSYPTRSGQSLSEYGMIFGLVVVVVIAAVVNLGSQNMAVLDESNRQLFEKQADGQSQMGHMEALLSTQNTNYISLTLSDGSSIELQHYPNNIPDSIQTASTDGTTTQLSLTIRDIGRSLLDQGKITQDEYNQFQGLANQGHRLARLEGLIEDAAKSVQTKAEFNQLKLNFEGYVGSPAELTLLLGGGVNDSAILPPDKLILWKDVREEIPPQLYNPKAPPERMAYEQFQLITQLNKLYQLPAIQKEPTLRNVLTELTAQISL